MNSNRRLFTVLLALVVLASTAACGGTGTPTHLSTAGLVQPPPVPLEGCTWTFNGSVPQGVPQGVQPSFPRISPDQAAIDALHHVKAHGGTGLVSGFDLPSSTPLHPGPDASSAPVATVPAGQVIVASEPVLWTDSSGGHWLAFFLACGGDNLYWVSVDQVAKIDGPAGDQLRRTIPALLAAPPYTTSHRASALPITLNNERHLVWKDPAVPFAVGRGELLAI